MRRSAEQRIADRGGDEYAVLLAPQELSRCTLQLRRDPDVPAVKKRTERVERSTVQPDADRAAELFLMPNCFPAPGQTLRPCNRLRGLGERHAIGISEIEADGTAKFVRAATSSRIERIEDALDRGAGGPSIHHPTEATEVREQNEDIGNSARTMALLDTIDRHRFGKSLECKTLYERGLDFRRREGETSSSREIDLVGWRYGLHTGGEGKSIADEITILNGNITQCDDDAYRNAVVATVWLC